MTQQQTENVVRKIVEIEGKKYAVTGTIDFNIKALEDPTTPIPDPEVDPNTGTIKEGSRWAKDPGAATSWKPVPMTDDDKKAKKLWKIVNKEQLNVIADIPDKETAVNLINYFITHKFPPATKEGGDKPTEPDEDQKPPVVDGQLVDDVKIPYKTTGKVRKDPYWNKRKDGLRLDFEDNPKDGSYVNNVTIFYGTFKDDIPDDEITFKWSWGRHSNKGDLVKTYGVGCNNKTGKTRMRMEWEHPDYTDNLAEGDEGVGIPVELGKSLGYMGVRKTLADGNVLLEYWQDRGGLDENGKPANDWIKLLSTIDTEYKVTDYSPNGIECTVRLDDDDNGWDNVVVKKSLCVEIE